STGLPTGEERNRVFGGGLSFTTAQSRVRGVAEMAWSRNSASETPIEVDSADREQADLAWRARLDADLLKGDSHALSTWVYKRRIAPGYVAVGGETPVGRDESAVGAHARLGSTTLDASFVEFTDNLDRKSDVLTKRDRAATATLGFDLSDYRVGGPLLPSALRLTTTLGRMTGLPEKSDGRLGDAAIDQRRLGFGIAADWRVLLDGANDVLTISAMRFTIDERRPGMETADTQEDSLSVIYTANRPYWTGSVAATVTEITRAEMENRSRTHRYSLSAYAATTPQAGSRLSLTAHMGHERKDPLDPGVDDDVETMWDITAGGEINRLVGAERIAGVLPIVAYLRVAGNDPDVPEEKRQSVELTAGVKARIVF
ncbi:MAG: hypothetical protein WD470_08835, partial [Rhodospirillaceae bacterium]